MKQNIDMADIQEQHLDVMIKLAFDMEDAIEVERILHDPDPNLTDEEVKFADGILIKALDISEKRRTKETCRRIMKVTRQVLPKAIEIAACIILVAALAAPIAFANSETFRAKVMQLLVEWDNARGEAHFKFSEDQEAAFWVPEGWIGLYYPSYIPSDFQIYDFDPFFTMVEYRNDNSDQLFFCEYDANTNLLAGTEESTISTIQINGHAGYLIEGKGANGITEAVTIIWSNDSKWFSITTFGLGTDESLLVATSVREIIK